jgi:hypothetical protein
VADERPAQGAEGAAVFPLIPEELGIHPLLLAALHAYVFLEGSDDEVVDSSAADEGLHYIVTYLQRLRGKELQRVREDIEALTGYAKQEKWPKQQVQFFKDFLKDNAIGTE